MKVIILLFLCCIIANAQSSNELQKKYGAPTSETYSEVYRARSSDYLTQLSASVTATYTKNKKVCRLMVELFPYSTSEIPINVEADALKTKLLDEVVDELMPKEKRGKYLLGSFINLGCYPSDGCSGTLEHYEKVSIYRNGNNHRYATISWKGVECK